MTVLSKADRLKIPRRPPSRGLRWVGDDFPPFRLTLHARPEAKTGGRLASDDWRGRRALVVVWPGHLSRIDQADLCVLCRGAKRLQGDGLEVAGIVTADPWNDLLPARCTPFPLALDPGRRVARALGLPARPGLRAVYLVGADGRIERAALADRVDPLLLDLVAAT